MSKFEVIRGVEGCCLALDDTRIAGPKPWGGGTVIHAWETDKTYRAIDAQSRWHELFGTPERAAETICRQLKYGNICVCDGCPVKPPNRECDREYDALLEWLKGGA